MVLPTVRRVVCAVVAEVVCRFVAQVMAATVCGTTAEVVAVMVAVMVSGAMSEMVTEMVCGMMTRMLALFEGGAMGDGAAWACRRASLAASERACRLSSGVYARRLRERVSFRGPQQAVPIGP
jgi:hypothetical protein